jgi:hypothetical protein
MEQNNLLLEYLKEQYTQTRQHETRQTNATTFLTAAAGAVIALALKDGELHPVSWLAGIVVFLVGLANWWINEAHYIGNRFHNSLAGLVRHALEDTLGQWPPGTKPSELRKIAIVQHGLRGSAPSIGAFVHQAIQKIPIGVMLVGVAIFVLSIGPKLCAYVLNVCR